jgi:hypothetical protein
MLLDPFEEQLHLPARLLECCNGDGVQLEIVGQQRQVFTRLGHDQMDAA